MRPRRTSSPMPIATPRVTLQRDPYVATVVIPGMRVEITSNRFRGVTRGAVFANNARIKAQRRIIRMVLDAQLGAPPSTPLHVTLTRVAPGEPDDDNLAAAFKGHRDEIADWLGVNDRRRDLVRYHPRMRKAARGEYALEIRIEQKEIEADDA